MSELVEILENVISGELTKIAAEAVDVRDRMETGTIDDDVVRLHEMLVHNRAGLDRLQAIAAALVLRKARASAHLRACQADLDDAYMKAATKKTVGFSDYATAKEKDAHFSLGTVAETMEQRKAENAFRDVEAVAEFVRTILRAAEGAHRDLELRVRMINLSSQLDR